MITTKRFSLTPLTASDANNNYLSWLTKDNTNGYIDYAKTKTTLFDLKHYIKERANNKFILFLGIHTKDNQTHIGNIKYEPINFEKNTATMGILIGDKNWRGKGVAAEVITASANHLKQKYNINTVFLGVDAINTAAISAYKKIGFKIVAQENNNIQMAWYLSKNLMVNNDDIQG